MVEVVILRSIPAGGKTTYSKQWIKDDANRVRVNREDIRFMLFDKGWGVDENQVIRIQDAIMVDALKHKKSVIVDNINLEPSEFKRVVELAAKNGVRHSEISVRDFPIDRRTAVARDKLRHLQGQRFVGEKVIDIFLSGYHIDPETGTLPPVPEVDVFREQRNIATSGTYQNFPWLPRAIIVDVDGTIADHTGVRGPYDTSKYHLDGQHERIIDLVNAYATHNPDVTVIVMSGRSEDFKEVTMDWIGGAGMIYDQIYMRPSGDTRKDAIVKSELFEKHINGAFQIDFILKSVDEGEDDIESQETNV